MSLSDFHIVPMEGYVCVQPAAPDKQHGRILLPDSAQEKPHWGTILAVGPGKDGKTPGFAAGDTVLYNRYSGAAVELPDKDRTEIRILSWDNVMAKLTPKT